MRSLLIQKGVRHERQTEVNNVVVYRGKYCVFDDSVTSLYFWIIGYIIIFLVTGGLWLSYGDKRQK